MKTLQVGLPETEPPSTSVIMVPETDGDKCVMAEIFDQVHAGRCPDPAKRQAATHGRILVSTLASEMGIKKAGDPLPSAPTQFIDQAAAKLSTTADALLGAAFIVRFFHW